jgi:hypothetical protein
MIFPALGPEYYDERDKGILSRMEAFYAESITINQSFWGEADTDSRFMAGDQTLWNDIYGNLPANRRRQFNFNRIARVVNMIDGHQRNNRKSTIVVGVENADDETADQFTKILMWINNQEGVLETISDSFRGSLVTGMNLLQVWMDYRSDPVSGNIRVDNCSYNSFLIDPFFRKADLSDCNAIWKRSYLTKRECVSLLPESAEVIASLEPLSNRDGKFQFSVESYNYNMKNLLTYDEYYYRDYRNQKLLVDAETGETQEWRSQDEEKLKEFLRTYPQVTVIECEIPTVKLAIVVQGKVMYDGPQPMGIDMYPFVPTFAYYYPQLPYFPWRIQGVVRGLRDSQYLYNRRKAIELDILESQINSGWIYKESALVNPKDVFLSGQGRGLALKDDAQMTDVQQILAPQIPPSMIELSKILGEEISQISGVNEELLGSATDDKAGILSMLRQGSGLTTLQILFDNLDHTQKLLGKIMINLIQSNFTPGKVKKILEGAEPTEQFYNKAFGKYDANVEEGLNTTNQKQMQFAQLLALREAGVPVPDDVLLQASTMQNKKELIQSIEQAKQQQMQAQQQQMESQMQLQQAQTNLANARAAADQGLGLERISRVEENQALAVERRAQAQHDMDAGLLDKVKALKELETLDMVHLEKLIAISHMLREDVVETPGEKKKNMVESAAANKLSQSPDLNIQASQQPQQIQSQAMQSGSV